jgi:hypothetical protein
LELDRRRHGRHGPPLGVTAPPPARAQQSFDQSHLFRPVGFNFSDG